MSEKPVLSPALLREMAEYNPIGMRLTPDDVEAWIDLIWLRFRERNYTRTKTALLRWWANVREEDILAARARVSRMKEEAEVEALERYAQGSKSADVVSIDHFRNLKGA